MATEQYNKTRKSFSLRKDLAVFLGDQSSSGFDGNDTACLEHMIEFYRASKQGPLSEYVHHQARVQEMLADHGLVSFARGQSIGVDFYVPAKRLGIEIKLRVPANTTALTVAITASHFSDNVDRVWLVLPDTSTQGDLSRWAGYVGQLPFSGVSVLTVSQADKLLDEEPSGRPITPLTRLDPVGRRP